MLQPDGCQWYTFLFTTQTTDPIIYKTTAANSCPLQAFAAEMQIFCFN
jgi:hypothetical protein